MSLAVPLTDRISHYNVACGKFLAPDKPTYVRAFLQSVAFIFEPERKCSKELRLISKGCIVSLWAIPVNEQRDVLFVAVNTFKEHIIYSVSFEQNAKQEISFSINTVFTIPVRNAHLRGFFRCQDTQLSDLTTECRFAAIPRSTTKIVICSSTKVLATYQLPFFEPRGAFIALKWVGGNILGFQIGNGAVNLLRIEDGFCELFKTIDSEFDLCGPYMDTSAVLLGRKAQTSTSNPQTHELAYNSYPYELVSFNLLDDTTKTITSFSQNIKDGKTPNIHYVGQTIKNGLKEFVYSNLPFRPIYIWRLLGEDFRAKKVDYLDSLEKEIYDTCDSEQIVIYNYSVLSLPMMDIAPHKHVRTSLGNVFYNNKGPLLSNPSEIEAECGDNYLVSAGDEDNQCTCCEASPVPGGCYKSVIIDHDLEKSEVSFSGNPSHEYETQAQNPVYVYTRTPNYVNVKQLNTLQNNEFDLFRSYVFRYDISKLGHVSSQNHYTKNLVPLLCSAYYSPLTFDGLPTVTQIHAICPLYELSSIKWNRLEKALQKKLECVTTLVTTKGVVNGDTILLGLKVPELAHLFLKYGIDPQELLEAFVNIRMASATASES